MAEPIRTKRGRPRSISREDIVREAARLFNEHGYDRTSLDMVAERFGVTKAGLYYHIASKEEIILVGCRLALDAFEARRAQNPPPAAGPTGQLRAFIRDYLPFIGSDFGRFLVLLDPRVLSSEAREAFLGYQRIPHRLVRGLIIDGIAAGEFRPADPELVTNGIFGMINWICHWRNPPSPADLERIRAEFEAMIFSGIAARP